MTVVARYAAASAAVVVAGLAATWLVPADAETLRAARVGVALAGASGAVALWLKARAGGKDLKAALVAVGQVFGLRAVLVALGLVWAVRQGGGAVGYVLGFFGVYFCLQWIEIGYVLAAHRAHRARDNDSGDA